MACGAFSPVWYLLATDKPNNQKDNTHNADRDKHAEKRRYNITEQINKHFAD